MYRSVTRLVCTALLTTTMALGMVVAVTPGPAGAAQLPPAKSCGAACPGQLVKWGGGGATLMNNPTVYLIFWGPAWPACANSANSTVMQSQINLFQGLAANATASVQNYNNILAQYIPGGNVPQYGGCWQDDQPPGNAILTQANFPTEIDRALTANDPNWEAGNNSLFLVFPQPGTRVSLNGEERPDFCAYHSYGNSALVGNATEIFGVEPYLTGTFGGCSANYGVGSGVTRVATAMTNASTHEYSEAATDPFWDGGAHLNRVPPVGAPAAKGWSTSPAGYEIGDLCSYPPFYLQGAGWVQYQWSNSASACVGAVTLGGPWACTKGTIALHFNPPLVPGGNQPETVTLSPGIITNCAFSVNPSLSAVAGGYLDNFTGTLPTNNCGWLNPGPAPALNGGTIDWFPAQTFESSGNINMTGSVIWYLGRIWLSYTGTVGTGSVAGPVGMLAISQYSTYQLANVCAGVGIRDVVFSDSGN